jgi:hypothetical protein
MDRLRALLGGFDNSRLPKGRACNDKKKYNFSPTNGETMLGDLKVMKDASREYWSKDILHLADM